MWQRILYVCWDAFIVSNLHVINQKSSAIENDILRCIKLYLRVWKITKYRNVFCEVLYQTTLFAWLKFRCVNLYTWKHKQICKNVQKINTLLFNVLFWQCVTIMFNNLHLQYLLKLNEFIIKCISMQHIFTLSDLLSK